MRSIGLKEVRFSFDFEGTKQIMSWLIKLLY
jgi:hypothetical protein